MEKRANIDPIGNDSNAKRPQVTLLKSNALDHVCTRRHLSPAPDLAPFIEISWSMEWKVQDDQTFTQQILPNPSVQVVVDSEQAQVFGIVTGAFSTTLEGEGFIFGLKFHPWGFYPFTRKPAAEFTDRRVLLHTVMPGVDLEALRRLAGVRDCIGILQTLEDELRSLTPKRDSIAADLESLIVGMEKDASMLTVEEAAFSLGVSRRTLQRLFHLHVGVSPKWMLRRFRLKEAAARIERGEHESMVDLAHRLGYYDQAHLIRDFRAMVGQPPVAWLRSGAAPS